MISYFNILYIFSGRWWRGLDHTSKLPPNFRERTVETWLAALMMYFEPQFSLGRIMSAKFYLAITFLDDACDTYASIDEVRNLVDCIERYINFIYPENL